jgi:hypothetical protein
MNSLVTFNTEEFDVMQRFAKAMVASGYFTDAKDIAQAFVKIQAGKELGLPPFASMTGIYVIQGKPVLGANVLATLVKNDPRYDYRIKQADDTACVLEWYEGGAKVGEAGFTMKEAQTAGLTNKDNWKKYASDMLFARAISRGSRRFAPGIFGGAPVYTPDELGADVDEDGNVVNGSFTVRDDFNQTNPAADNDFNQDVPKVSPTPKKPTKTATVTAEQQKPSEAQMKQLHAAGSAFYGDEWDTQRPKIVKYVSEGRVTSSKLLTLAEWQKAIDGINAKADAAA